jgi:hypothetical protein
MGYRKECHESEVRSDLPRAVIDNSCRLLAV